MGRTLKSVTLVQSSLEDCRANVFRGVLKSVNR